MSLKLTLTLPGICFTISFQQVATIFHSQNFFCQNLPPDFFCSANLPPVNDRATVMFSGESTYVYLSNFFCYTELLVWSLISE